MKHPDTNDWMAHVYAENDESERRALEAHLSACPECADRVRRWRETQALLGAPEPVPKPEVVSRWPRPRATWAAAAAAAALFLGIGFAVGRQGVVSRADLDSQLAALRSQWREDLAVRREAERQDTAQATLELARADQQEFLNEFLRRYQVARAEDRVEWMAALESAEARRGADSAALREGLVRLASSTGSGFENTQSQLRLLADFLPADAGEDGPLPETKNMRQIAPQP